MTEEGWVTDDEESPEFNVKHGKVGAEYYGIVVSYKDALMSHIIPNIVKLDEYGRAVKSKYQNKKTKEDEYELKEGNKETVKTERIKKWTTKSDVLNKMESVCRAANTAIKQFINNNWVGVWYHNANSDDCAMFGGVHWHILLASKEGANGTYQYIHDCNKMRTMRMKCRAAGGYVYAAKAHTPLMLTRHLNCAPRKYAGCNHIKIKQLYDAACKEGVLENARMEDFLEKEDDEEEEELKKLKAEKRYNSWEDSDHQVSEAKRVKSDGWTDDYECERDNGTSFIVPRDSGLPVMIKETTTDKYIKCLKKLMQRYWVDNVSEIYLAIGSLRKDEDVLYQDLWRRLSTKPGIDRLVRTALESIKCETMSWTFEQRVDYYCRAPSRLDKNKDYHTPLISYKLFKKWVERQNWDLAELVTNTVNVMNKVHNKINTICIIGETNAGKTTMFANPLGAIMRHVGRMANRGNESPFVWENCVNCSVIIINECVVAPALFEDLKNILEGEKSCINQKGKGHGSLQRIPIILTGNRPPWALDASEEKNFRTRMFYYNAKTDPELAKVDNLHPGMWWYLLQQYEQHDGLIPLKELKPYPEPNPCDEFDGEDVMAINQNLN